LLSGEIRLAFLLVDELELVLIDADADDDDDDDEDVVGALCRGADDFLRRARGEWLDERARGDTSLRATILPDRVK
jgi:hypothetical protein